MTTEVARAICKKFIEIQRNTTPGVESPKLAYLRGTFMGCVDEFNQFVGFMENEIFTINMDRDEAVRLMGDIAIVAVSIGRRDGQQEYLRRYGKTDFQFLLKDEAREVTA